VNPAVLTVSTVISRIPVSGRRDDLLEWARDLCEGAAESPGYLESRIFDTQGEDSAVVVRITFSSASAMAAWEASAQRRTLLSAGASLTMGPPRAVSEDTLTNLLAPIGGNRVRPRWLTALLVWIALVPPALLVAYVITPHLQALPLFVAILCTTPLTVAAVIWVTLPPLHIVEERLRRRFTRP